MDLFIATVVLILVGAGGLVASEMFRRWASRRRRMLFKYEQNARIEAMFREIRDRRELYEKMRDDLVTEEPTKSDYDFVHIPKEENAP